MPQNKETSIGVKLVADLRNYQKNLSTAQKQTKTFSNNVKNNVGDVKNSFQALMRGDITALPGFFKSSTTAAGGFAKGLKGVKAALISTGIGAILVGIGLAIGAVTQYFRGTEEGQIVFKKVMNNIKAYTEPVLQMFGKFGKAIVQLFKGDFEGAWETAKSAVEGVGTQIKANTKEVGKLNAAEEKLIKFRRENLITNKKLESEINEARRIANDEDNYSAAQRAKAISEAIEKQKQLAANKKTELDLETQIAETKASFGDNDIATNDELAQLKANQFDIISEQERAIKRMAEDQQRINREVKAEITAREQLANRMASQAETKNITTVETRKFSGNVGLKIKQPTELADMGSFIDSNTEKVKRLREEMDETMSATEQVDFMANSFYKLGGAIGGSAGSFLSFAGNILSMIPQLIMQITALTAAEVAGNQAKQVSASGAAIAKGTEQSQSVPFPFNLIALAVTIASIVAALAKAPKFATGGVVGGNSFFGDNVIARVNSGEEILTRNDPRHRYNQQNISTTEEGGFVASTRMHGDDLLILIERAKTRRRNRT